MEQGTHKGCPYSVTPAIGYWMLAVNTIGVPLVDNPMNATIPAEREYTKTHKKQQ